MPSNSHRAPKESCELCNISDASVSAGFRCQDCILKGNTVGMVVWKKVAAEVRKASSDHRVLFMLSGLSAKFLEGICRTAPTDKSYLDGRTLRLPFHPESAPMLEIMPPAEASYEAATHWRHSDDAQIILFSTTDDQIQSSGAGLAPITRIDGHEIQSRVDDWCDVLNETGDAVTYLRKLLRGLKNSDVILDLDMWVSFVLELKDQGFAKPVELRIQDSVHTLRIPRGGVRKLPTLQKVAAADVRHTAFASAFRDAKKRAGIYATLMKPGRSQESVNVEKVRMAIARISEECDCRTKKELKVIEKLLDDENIINPNDWLSSQQQFCELVRWDWTGRRVFEGATRDSINIGAETRQFISDYYGEALTVEDIKILDEMPSRAPKEVLQHEIDLYLRHQERLNHPDASDLNKRWQNRIFPKEVVEEDLRSILVNGLEFLMKMYGSSISNFEKPRILVRASRHNVASVWNKMDSYTLRLFQFELQSISEVTSESVIWDLKSALNSNSTKRSKSSMNRVVKLELYLVDAADDEFSEKLKSTPRVRATWKPTTKLRNEPITYALPRDIVDIASAAKAGDGIFKKLTFTLGPNSDPGGEYPVTIADVSSFTDVFNINEGRMFHTSAESDGDILADIRRCLLEHKDRQHEVFCVKSVLQDLDAFEKAYRCMILKLKDNPKSAVSGNSIVQQATAFGKLCRSVRENIPGESNAGRKIRPLLADLGVIRSRGNQDLAILAAWHPLRLAEWRARMFGTAKLISSIMGRSRDGVIDSSIVYEQYRMNSDRWLFPEALVLKNMSIDGKKDKYTTMTAIENIGGYTLFAPVDRISNLSEQIERGAQNAAESIAMCVEQYLRIQPHTAAGLTILMYETESITLPRNLILLLEKLIQKNRHIRCNLIIAHSSQYLMHRTYRDQNHHLMMSASGEASGYLRVCVKSIEELKNSESLFKDVNIAFVYGAISNFSRIDWVCEPGMSDEMSIEFDLSELSRPRWKVGSLNSDEIDFYLISQSSPQPVAEYYNLLYEVSKSAVLPKGFHGSLIRRVLFNNEKLGDVIVNAHNVADWVITIDGLANKSLLKNRGVKIINNASMPNVGNQSIISSWKINDRLKTKLISCIQSDFGVDIDEACLIGDRVIEDVEDISGQKLLSAARFSNASRELIGLSAMRTVLEACLSENAPRPMWFSLDDYRGWFTSVNQRVADAIAFTISDEQGRYRIFIQVGEAKYITSEGVVGTLRSAKEQVKQTVDRLNTIFTHNEDFDSRSAWGARLATLFVSHESFSVLFRNEKRREKFIRLLISGDVEFAISGEVVVGLCDDYQSSVRSESDEHCEYLRSHVVPTPLILETLRHVEKGKLATIDSFSEANWLCSKFTSSEIFSTKSDSEDRNVEAHVDEAFDNNGIGDVALQKVGASKNFDASQKYRSTEDGENLIEGSRRNVANVIPKPVLGVLYDMKGREPSSIDDTSSREWAEETCTRTQRALSHFQMHAEFADPKFRLTPNGVLIGFRGHSTLTVDKLEKKRSEMLTTHGIDVVDIRPSPGTISLFVKREPRAQVPLASTWLDAPWPDCEAGDLTNFAIGVREDDGNLLFLNLAGKCGGYDEHGPHTLIAGETGSGKGILTQGLLLQLIAFNDPKNVEIVLVDPKKGVDFVWLEGVPHMREEIVTERQQAQEAFGRLVHEMDRRYDLFRKEGVADIARYNSRVTPDDRLPRTFLVHDELGSWMAQEKDYKETVLSSVSNLGMKARAAGIHLVLITQRADADAVPPRLRDNMNNRLCLKVQNSTGSTMVLNKVGAERLLGKGHLACQLANQPMPAGQEFFVVQVPYADPDDMERLAEAAKSHWGD